MNNINYCIHDPDYTIKICHIPFDELTNNDNRYRYEDFNVFTKEYDHLEYSLMEMTGSSKKLMVLVNNMLVDRRADISQFAGSSFLFHEGTTPLFLALVDRCSSTGLHVAKASIRSNIFN